jgi:hypothetical protein
METLQLWPNKARIIIKEKGISRRALRKMFPQILFPWDDRYDQQRMLFSSQIQERPLFIIKPISEEQIIQALNLLPVYKLSIRIVGGRHSSALQSPDMFLDISAFKKIEVKKVEGKKIEGKKVEGKKYLVVGGGATQGEVNDFLFTNHKGMYFPGCKPNHPNTLAFPGGTAATVGVSGISTVGGIGTLRRTLGLTIDDIKSYRIVVPPKSNCGSAKVVVASKHENSDLFWALLGGGGANFGVITEIVYYPLKVNKVILYEINWHWDQAARILDLWQETAPSRPNAFNEDMGVFNGVDGSSAKFGVNLIGIYVIPDGQSSKEAIRTIREEIAPLDGDVHIDEATMYQDVYEKFVARRVYHNFSVGKTILTKETIPGKIFVKRIEAARKNKAYVHIGLQLMGGKISDRSSSATAYYPRKAKIFVDIFAFWDSAVYQQASLHWSARTFFDLYAIAGPYSYLGFPVPNLPNHLNAYYGKNAPRLLEIKKQIDPLNLLIFPGSL